MKINILKRNKRGKLKKDTFIMFEWEGEDCCDGVWRSVAVKWGILGYCNSMEEACVIVTGCYDATEIILPLIIEFNAKSAKKMAKIVQNRKYFNAKIENQS